MALDHASLMFNAGRAEEELAAAGPPVFANLMQFLTRFAGVPLVLRLADSYGNAHHYTRVDSIDFWIFSKYLPDLAFLSWSCTCIFLSLALLATIAPRETPRWLRPFEIFWACTILFLRGALLRAGSSTGRFAQA
jgi:hypothetical protein